KPPVDFGGAIDGHSANRAIAVGFEPAALARFVELRLVECAKPRERAVGEHDVELEDVIDGFAVQDRPGAARIVRDHAAEGGATRRGDVWREAKPVDLELRVQLVEDDARLDPGRQVADADVDDAVEILGGIELYSRANRLAGLRRAAASRRDRYPVPA